MVRNKKKHDYWNIFIGGLLQDEYEPHGIFLLYDKINSLDKYNSYTEFYTWNENWYSIARKIYLLAQLHKKIPIINICAYSWGSHGLIQLANYLGDFGYSIQHAIMSDPVFKLKFFPAATLFSKNIYLPANIQNIYYFKQSNKWPKGHDVYQRNAFTYNKIEPLVSFNDSNTFHEDMDELKEFHDLTIQKFLY